MEDLDYVICIEGFEIIGFFCVCSNFVLGLDKVDGIGGIGDLSFKFVVVLLLVWFIVFFVLKKGVKFFGKVCLVFCNICV